jgi:hypothetical protein
MAELVQTGGMERCPRFVRSIALALTALGSSPGLRGQCDNEWQAHPAVGGPMGPTIASTVWDPDGPGPATPMLAMAASVDSVAGFQAAASGVVALDPTTEVVPIERDPFGAIRTITSSNSLTLTIGAF